MEARRPQSMLHSGVASIVLSTWGLVLAFVSVPVMLKGLGLAEYGVYSIAFVVAGYGAFLDLGFGWAGIKFVAEAHARGDGARISSILWALIVYQSMVGGVLLVVLSIAAEPLAHWLASGAAHDAGRLAHILPVAALWFMLSSLTGILVGVLRGVTRYVAAAVVAGAAHTIGVGGAAVAVAWGYGLEGAVLLQIVGAASALLLAVVALRDHIVVAARGAPGSSVISQLRQMLNVSLWSLTNRLVQIAVLQGDKLIAAKAAGAAGLPFYSVPFGLAQRLNVLGSAAVTAIYPVAALYGGSRDEFVETYFRASRVVHLLTAAPAITMIVLAPLLLDSWLGPLMASAGAGYLRALAVGFWIISVGSVEAGCLEGWGHARLTALAACAGVMAALVTGAVLATATGLLWAVAGAVCAWMVTTAAVNAVTWYSIAGLSMSRLRRELVYPVAEMVTLGVLAGEVVATFIPPGPVGIAACGGLCALLALYGSRRMFGIEERRMLWGRVAALVAGR